MRRLRFLVLLGLAVAVVLVRLRRRDADPVVQPSWPPLLIDPPPPAAALADAPDAGAGWVLPVDGACPADHPVKVGRSGIFHVPDGSSYGRTTPVRCYARADDAQADGYRRAKR